MLKELRDQKSDSPARRTKRLRRFEREIAALGRLNLSPNIPSVVDSHVSLDGSYLVTPYAGKNLEKLRKLVDPQAILQRFRGFVQAVKYANDREVVHRDIKPNNTTVNDDGTPCLVDFGICMYDDEIGLTDTMEGFGNRYFAAPECDAGNPEPIGPPSDIYSLGKLLHWMATDRGKMGREDFDEEAFTFTDRFARQYFWVRSLSQRQNLAPCYFCGKHALMRSAGDLSIDPRRVQVYCDNDQCDARETEVIVMRDGTETTPTRTDVRILERFAPIVDRPAWTFIEAAIVYLALNRAR